MSQPKFLLVITTLLIMNTSSTAQLRVSQLRVENLHNPLGLDIRQPQFSWQLQATEKNCMQTAYEIRIGQSPAALSKGKITWTSGKQLSDQSVQVTYQGPELQSGTKYYWQVRVWDNQKQASAWSETAYWQMGLLNTTDWKASWISPAKEDSLFAAPLMRKEFSCDKKIVSAAVYITAHGLYEARLNGKKIGLDCLTPGWTSYNNRLQYQVYNVTDLLKQGNNAVAVMLGDGWYRGNFSFDHRRNIYGKDIALLLQMEIHYADGSTSLVNSDAAWKSSTGPVRSSTIYAGEIIDANKTQLGWDQPGFNDKDWQPVLTGNFNNSNLVGTYNEPVREQEKWKALKIFRTPAGEMVADFGQNLVGKVKLKAQGKKGDTITLYHAEVLDKKGNFYTENLRAAKAMDRFILSGSQLDIFEPAFTWHGFRYVKLDNYPGTLRPEDIEAVVMYSDMETAGTFSCSDTLINQLQHNIEWGLKGNFLDVPTDCPQRDERMGWTGDAQVFFRTASFLRGVNNFFSKWMKDLAADQVNSGSVPHVIPNILGSTGWAAGGSAGWSDASTMIPWEMYEVYGDKRILENQYNSMKAWVSYMQSQSTNDLWNKGSHFGDWLFYTMADDNDGKAAITNKYLIAQCFYAHSTRLLINAAKILGKMDDVTKYSALLQKIKKAFLDEYTTPNGATMSNTQTSYVLALQFDLYPESLRQQAADRLVNNIKQYGNHLTTGFLGTPYLCHVLSRYGYADMAYTLLLQKTYPSWLYPVTKGATTIWERWDGIRTDGSFQAITMNSFNHYAYGAIGDWLYRVMVGIDNDEGSVGYKKIRIKPVIGGGLTEAKATYQTQYGMIAAGWKLEKTGLSLQVTIPVNTTATIYVPVKEKEEVLENGIPVDKQNGLRVIGREKGYASISVGSGQYSFSTREKQP